MSLDALFEAVYASPDDELIALQLHEHAGIETAEMRERARELVGRHAHTWFRALQAITFRGELRRGFLHRLELRGGTSGDALDRLALDRLAHDATLATVEEVATVFASGEIVARLLAGRLGANLRSIATTFDETWSAIESSALPRLRELHVFDPRIDFTKRVLPYIEARPAITRIDCAPATKLSKALCERLEALTMHVPLGDGLGYWTTMPQLRRLDTGIIELVRDGALELARIRGLGQRMVDLAQLPRSMTRVEVRDPALARRLAAEYGARLEIVTLEEPTGRFQGQWPLAE